MTNVARSERRALCDTFEQVGADAPTLCGDWRSADLAAHLVVRECKPHRALGILVPAMEDATERAMQQTLEDQGFDGLVARLRGGPPAWHPTRLAPVDDLVNTFEMYVHHEDVLRGDGTPGPTRTLDDDLADALAAALARMGKVLLRGSPAPVELADPDRGLRVRGGRGDGEAVVVTGPVGELALFVYGRQDVADVDLEGPDDAVAAVRNASLGP